MMKTAIVDAAPFGIQVSIAVGDIQEVIEGLEARKEKMEDDSDKDLCESFKLECVKEKESVQKGSRGFCVLIPQRGIFVWIREFKTGDLSSFLCLSHELIHAIDIIINLVNLSSDAATEIRAYLFQHMAKAAILQLQKSEKGEPDDGWECLNYVSSHPEIRFTAENGLWQKFLLAYSNGCGLRFLKGLSENKAVTA